MFPEWDAQQGVKPRRVKPWKPSSNERVVHELLSELASADEDTLHERLAGRVNKKQIAAAIDGLSRHGLVKDTGERGRWTRRGRLIIWAAVTP